MRNNVRSLTQKANKAVQKGKYAHALRAYLALEELEPKKGEWPRRAADMYRRLNQSSQAIETLGRAVQAYSNAGFLVKAIAVCKLILHIDPSHKETQKRLAGLNAERGLPGTTSLEYSISNKKSAAPIAAMPTLIANASPRRSARRTIPPGAPIDSVALKDIIPGAVSKLRRGSHSGISEIPLDLEDVEILGNVDFASPLRTTPLFSHLNQASMELLIERVELIELAPGDILFREGDVGSKLYVVADGTVEVISGGTRAQVLSQLGHGEFFGEIALLTEQPRSATIQASRNRPVQLLGIDRTIVSDLVDQDPRILSVLLRFLRDRLLDRFVHTSSLFAAFTERERKTISGRFLFLEVEPRSVIIEQEEQVEGLYVMLSGQAELVRRTPNGTEELLSIVGSGGICGEMSLLARAPAVATVRTISKSFVLMLPSIVFHDLIMTHPHVLSVVAELADEHRKMFEAAVRGDSEYQNRRVDLI